MSRDEELHAAAMAGGPEAFGPIVERYQDAVFGVALTRLGNFHDAQDVAQQVFLEAYVRLGNLRDPNRLGAWLRTIAIHTSIDHLSKHLKKAKLDGLEVKTVETPHGVLERNQLREQVMAAIGQLSQTHRETTTLFYINGYSVAEVAAVQEVPVGTVKRRLYEAREKLKEGMVSMVEEVLKGEAPKDDFGSQVFEMLSQFDRPPLSGADWGRSVRQTPRHRHRWHRGVRHGTRVSSLADPCLRHLHAGEIDARALCAK